MPVLADLIAKGMVPHYRRLAPVDLDGESIVLHLDTYVKTHNMNQKAGKEMDGFEISITRVSTGEHFVFRTQSQSLYNQMESQIMPYANDLDPNGEGLTVTVNGEPSTKPGKDNTIYHFD